MTSVSPRSTKQKPKADHEGVVMRHVNTLLPSPENNVLYRDRDSRKPDRKRLVESIRKTNGPKAPLLVSLDAFIISGHERHAASIEAGIDMVKVLVQDLRRSDHTPDEWLSILREHNTGRDKTQDEKIREKIVDVDPDEAMSAVVDFQIERAKPKSKTVVIPDKIKKRSKITKQSRDFADAIISILTGPLKNVLPVNERAVHYRLLPPLNVRTSRGVKGFVYGNDKRSVKALSRMLTRLRLIGEVPWEWICDETRPVSVWKCFRDAAEFLGEEMNDLYTGFARDLLQSQSAHYEIITEKLTVKSFIDPVAMRYTMPVAYIRGSSGIDARYQVAQRYRASGKSALVMFILSDCDPAGDMICESTTHSMRDEFGVRNVSAIRVSMTHQQADEQGVSSSVDVLLAKESSVTPKFIKRHGRNDCYELEAVSPETLSQWLDEAIRGNIDVDVYNHEVEEQAKDVAKIRATRAVTLEAIRSSSDAGGVE
ncbi:MAG: hypothetical protein NTZ32_08020 [Planctomycetales bacterium]|nr:hypothetical protein [Planctomycetales bacterium]